MPKLHIYKNEKETCQAFAQWFAELVKETLTRQDWFTIALSAGETPKQLYKILEADYANAIEWSKIHVFIADETFVSSSDEKDNSKTAFKLFIDHVGISKEQVHVIQTDMAPEESAKQYDTLLHTFFDNKKTSFDLVILGDGEQGNMLSFFSSAEESMFKEALAVAVYNQQHDLFKVTLTIPVINAAAVKAFLLTGKSKEDVVQQVLKGKYDPERYPAQLIQVANKSVHWFLDEGAAGKLMKSIS